MQNRRMFLGSAAAAGVGVAVGGAIILPGPDTYAQDQITPPDPILLELKKQLAESVVAIRKGQGRLGEHARRIAATIRLLTAHGVAASVDGSIHRVLRDEGRDALLARELSRATLVAELKPLGIDQVPALTATYADRVRTLDAIVNNGMAATLATLSAAFDRIGSTLDRRAVMSVSRQDPGECFEWTMFLSAIEAMMVTWCTAGPDTCYMGIWVYLSLAYLVCALGCNCIV